MYSTKIVAGVRVVQVSAFFEVPDSVAFPAHSFTTQDVSYLMFCFPQELPSLDGSVSGSSSSSRLGGTKSAPKTSLASAAVDTAGCHRDAITSLALGQTSQRLLISSSRDGAVKVWK